MTYISNRFNYEETQRKNIPMKILHTSDLHLRKEEDERWEALENLIQLGKKEKIEIMVISGDLFDTDTNAEELRPKIRSLFSKTGFQIVIIPGNHDERSYEGGKYFGDDVHIILDYKTPFEWKNVRIWGCPFERIKEKQKVYRRLYDLGKKTGKDEKTDILLFHGELLKFYYSKGEFGEEEEGYMPAEISYFKGFKYVLAGHFHTKYSIEEIEGGGYFVYSGSPVSITKREKGKRCVNLFEVGNPPQKYELNTFHYEELEVSVDDSDAEPFEKIKKAIDGLHPHAWLVQIKIKGYINGEKTGINEEEFNNGIREMVKEKFPDSPIDNKVIDIGKILTDELYQHFLEKAKNLYDENKIKELKELVISAMKGVRLQRR